NLFHHSRGLAQHVGLLADGDRLVSKLARMAECSFANPSRCRTGDDAYRNGEVLSSHIGERLELGMSWQRIAHLLWRIRPLHSGIETFRILAEDDDIHLGLFKSTIRFLADEVQWVPRKRQARPHADVEIENLSHRNNWAEILQTLAFQRRDKIG